jgi:L-ascorbate metabolism protein UlaG (beta-lactamase superfamily)
MFQYVSNAGIVFNIEGKTVGIDCLCRDSSMLYQDTPLEIREKLMFDILIFTHEHEDHFCAEYVKEASEKNPNLLIYAGENAISMLQDVNIPSSQLHKVKDGDALAIGDTLIRFIQTLHEGEQYADIQNLTLLINIVEKHLVITGDAMPCKELFEKISAWASGIDWLFAPFPYVGLRSTRKLINEYLDVQNIFVLHQPRKEADTQNWIVSTKRVCEVERDGLPHPIFPEKLGEKYCI